MIRKPCRREAAGFFRIGRPTLTLFVQIVDIAWTKATRGAPRANERAALPHAFSLEPLASPFVLQRYCILEREGFAPRHLPAEAKDSIHSSVGMLRIVSESDGTFRLGFMSGSGQPQRFRRNQVLRMAPGEYVRLVTNARHTSSSGQHYSETVFNVTCGEGVGVDRFLKTPPDREFDEKAHLF